MFHVLFWFIFLTVCITLIISGATGRNGGHCWPPGATPSRHKYSAKISESLKQAAAFDAENFRLLQETITELGIDCDWKQCGGVEVGSISSESLILHDDLEDIWVHPQS